MRGAGLQENWVSMTPFTNNSSLAVSAGDLRVCLARFAEKIRHSKSRTWITPTDILYSTMSNWFTDPLRGDSFKVHIRVDLQYKAMHQAFVTGDTFSSFHDHSTIVSFAATQNTPKPQNAARNISSKS